MGTSLPLFSESSETQLTRLHEVLTPGGRDVEFGGLAQTNRDSVAAITSRLPLKPRLDGGHHAGGALPAHRQRGVADQGTDPEHAVAVRGVRGDGLGVQDGHLGALGTTATGTLVANMPVLLFCVAFGLSMDYEVFLVSRIREFWLASLQPRPTTTRAAPSGWRTPAG